MERAVPTCSADARVGGVFSRQLSFFQNSTGRTEDVLPALAGRTTNHLRLTGRSTSGQTRVNLIGQYPDELRLGVPSRLRNICQAKRRLLGVWPDYIVNLQGGQILVHNSHLSVTGVTQELSSAV